MHKRLLVRETNTAHGENEESYITKLSYREYRVIECVYIKHTLDEDTGRQINRMNDTGNEINEESLLIRYNMEHNDTTVE